MSALVTVWRWPRGPPSSWGPPAWGWLHREAIAYPQAPTFADGQLAFRRIWAFVAQLPCARCRSHAIQYILARPPDLASSKKLQEWMWRFHNAVNARLGKPLMPYCRYEALYSLAGRTG